MKERLQQFFSFEFWQKFGKCLMVVIAVMPAAGLMVSIGNSIPLINPNSPLLANVGNVLRLAGVLSVIFICSLPWLLVVAGLKSVRAVLLRLACPLS